MKPSLVCHGYLQVGYIHSGEWFVKSKHMGAYIWNEFFCVEWMTYAMASGYG